MDQFMDRFMGRSKGAARPPWIASRVSVAKRPACMSLLPLKLDSLEPAVRYFREFAEDLWFDRTRNVRTAGEVTLQAAGLHPDQHHDSELYQPARPRHIRQALRQLPAADLSEFTFVDLGSGKGRTLFVAAEFPFARIIGVEFSMLLHEQALRNVGTFRTRRASCRTILPLHGNAKQFIFPDGKLVLYLFNPFGRETMQHVRDRLVASLMQDPRHVIVVLLWPQWEDLVTGIPGMRLTRKAEEYRIFHIEEADARKLQAY